MNMNIMFEIGNSKIINRKIIFEIGENEQG